MGGSGQGGLTPPWARGYDPAGGIQSRDRNGVVEGTSETTRRLYENQALACPAARQPRRGGRVAQGGGLKNGVIVSAAENLRRSARTARVYSPMGSPQPRRPSVAVESPKRPSP